MSQKREKREKRIRQIARYRYNAELYIWYKNKPSRWRIFRYMKWKKAMPRYTGVEKEIRNIVKAGA